jgi:hypothetical protein
MGVIQYDSNNSGGGWWLTDDDWRALEEAGWTVHWIHDFDDPSHTHGDDERTLFGAHRHAYEDEHLLTKVTPSGERWLDALATSAARATDDPGAAVREWEKVTGANASVEGCNCCGPPHSFTFTDNEGNRRYTSVEVTRTELRWD